MATQTAVRKGRRKGYVEERIRVESPPSLALAGLESYLASQGNVIRLALPLREIGVPTGVGLDHRVKVACDAHPNRMLIGRQNERLNLRWVPVPAGPYPTFEGTLTILPLGTATELVMRGEYEPPLGRFGAFFDSWAGNRIARATARALLETLKGALESQFTTIKSLLADPVALHA